MQGAQFEHRPCRADSRIIPADAGSTEGMNSSPYDRGDHPRGCGEHCWTLLTHCRGQGSSPRMRGAPPSRSAGAVSVRIIPADAGSTNLQVLQRWHGEDHPRGCGEHMGFAAGGIVPRGSSPRMRGAPAHAHAHHRHQRIIPADAGSTRFSPPKTLCLGDHPRGCGEHRP